MNNILLVIEREFLTRVKKKSFIIMTILSPLLFAGLILVPAFIASMKDKNERTIAVIDDSHLFHNKLPETEYLKFQYIEDKGIDEVKDSFEQSGYYAVLYIGHVIATSPDGVILYSNSQPSIDITSHISGAISKEIENQKLKSYNIENLDEILKNIKTNVRVRTVKWTKDGEAKESSTELAMGIAYILSFMIYMMIFMFGSQVMRGVIEEKSNRIVEVIVSSVKPFQLMMGKILGIAAVGITQILIWIVLTYGLVTVFGGYLAGNQTKNQPQQEMPTSIMNQGGSMQAIPAEAATDGVASSVLSAFGNTNFIFIIGWFIFFFLGGYLLYAAMFAAVGSAVDNEADTQQLILPITMPLILGLIIMASTFTAPEKASTILFWFSIIPFTSPIVMMTRLPYEPQLWELLLSASLLIVTFILITWLAGKIYRVGILMYGKKHTWKEMWKWIRYGG